MIRKFFFVLFSIMVVSVVCFAQETPAEEPVVDSTAAVAEAPAAVAEAPTLVLEAIQICTAVEDRQPVGAGTVFADNSEKIYCFTKIVGATDAISVYHVWYMGDKEVSKVSLSVKSSPWRTWSSKVLAGIGLGKGRVEVLAEDGTLLGKTEFEIQATEVKTEAAEGKTEEPAVESAEGTTEEPVAPAVESAEEPTEEPVAETTEETTEEPATETTEETTEQ